MRPDNVIFTMVLAESNNLSVNRVLDGSTEDLRVIGVLLSAFLLVVLTHVVKYIFAVHSSVVIVSGRCASEHRAAESVSRSHSLVGRGIVRSRLDSANVQILILEQV